MSRWVALIAIAFGLLAIGAGCMGGDENANDGGGTAARRAIEAEAQSRAEAAVLRLSDFPDGWRASAPEDEETGRQDEFRRCLGTDYSDLTLTGFGESDDFAMGGSTEVTSEAGVYANEAEARAALEEFASGFDGDVERCVSDLIREGVEGENVEVGEIDAGELSFTPPPGVDEARAWQIAVTVEVRSGATEGLSATVYLDLIYLREGDLVVVVDTEEALSPFDSELRDELLGAVAGRVATEATSSK